MILLSSRSVRNIKQIVYPIQNRHFWAEGYYVSTVGLNEATIKKYIQEQEKQDIAMDKLSVKEYENSFKGSR
ncbi:transposase [Clostridium porci]|uniref:transposase n=1 Tax=Clostridium porci TaxID=2605778 RepID=UPI002E27466F